jgi:SAM-dependent methyltransferase
MDIPGHGPVRGCWNLRDFVQYVGGVSLAGKKVLDVGSASGQLSFEAERVGAEVLSFDAASISQMIHLPFAENLYFRDRDAWDKREEWGLQMLKNSYWYAHKRFNSRCRVVYGDIFRLDRSVPELQDVVIAGAIMEHLNDPVSALGSMARVARETIVIAFTPVLDTDELVAKPILPLTNPSDDITWWMYSRGLYRRILENVGFEIVSITPSTALDEGSGVVDVRQTIIARRRRGLR